MTTRILGIMVAVACSISGTAEATTNLKPFDPVALFAPEKAIRAAARGVLDAFGPEPGHIFNLGHGIAPTTPPAAVAALVDEVRAYSSARSKTRKSS